MPKITPMEIMLQHVMPAITLNNMDNGKTCNNEIFKSNRKKVHRKIKSNMKNEKLNYKSNVINILQYYKLSTNGEMCVLQQRLANLTTKYNIDDIINCPPLDNTTLMLDQVYNYLLIIDFEATCQTSNPIGYRHEIIEFPMVLFNTITQQICDVFREICRPVLNPRLSPFCISFTGISQNEVDNAASFKEVLSRAEAWMLSKGLGESSFVIFCDCNADCAKFLRIQCEISGITFPIWARRWHNLNKSFRNFYKIPHDQHLSLQSMLSCVGFQFEGRPHCGLDDALNILRVAKILMEDGYVFYLNEQIDMNRRNYVTPLTPKEAAEFSQGSGEGWSRISLARQLLSNNDKKKRKSRRKFPGLFDNYKTEDADVSLADLMRYVQLRNT